MRVLIKVMLVVCVLSGCGSAPREQPEVDVVAAAERFGRIAIPDDADVLKAGADSGGMDDAYRIALRTTPAGAERLIDESDLGEGRDEDDGSIIYTQEPLAGPALESGSGVESWQQSYEVSPGKRIWRNVTVDSRDTPTVYVHLLLFET